MTLSPELRAEVEATTWYHTIELESGLVTKGYFDTRGALPHVPFPASLEGKRCLDIGTYDGFWAFELERRGAREVVTIDVLDPRRWDWPPDSEPATIAEMGEPKARSRGFDIARAALDSQVERRDLSVYDLSPETAGSFDCVYLGSLLLHLRDPLRALAAVRSVCTGDLVSVDAIDLGLTLRHPGRPVAHLDGRGRPWWWKPNAAGFARMVEAAGFRVVEGPRRFFMPFGAGATPPRATARALLLRPQRLERASLAWRGDPHAALRAQPLSA